MGMSYVYGLFVQDTCFYIGQTKREPQQRFKEHMRDINNQVHSIKSLNKLNSSDIDCRVLLVMNTDNTLLLSFAECLMNSIYKPKNKCVLQQGNNKVILQRCDTDVAKKLLNVLKNLERVV